MTFGKDAPPLPMYQPVKLKHVPTMVRRRYEKFDADKIQPNTTTTHVNDEELVTYDSKSEDDTDAETDAYASLDKDSGAEDETEDIGHENSSIEQGSTSEDSSRNGEQLQNEQPESTEAANVVVFDDDRHNNGYESSGDKDGNCKREDSLNNAHLSYEEAVSHVADDCGSSVIIDHCESEIIILQDAVHDGELNVDVAHDCQQRENEFSAITEQSTGAWSKDFGNSTKPTGHCKSEDNGFSDTHHSGEVDAVVADDCQSSGIKCTIDENSFQDQNPTSEVDAVAVIDCQQADKVCAVIEDNTGACSNELGNGSIQLTDDCGSTVIIGDCESEDIILQNAIHNLEVNVDVAHDCQQRQNELFAITKVTEQSTGAWSDDVSSGNTKSTGHCESEDNGLSDTHHSGEVNSVVEDDCAFCVIKCIIDENSIQDRNPTSEVDAAAANDCQQADKGCTVNEDYTGACSNQLGNGSIQSTGSQTEDTNFEDDRIAVASHVCHLDSDIENESQNKVPDINDGFWTQENRNKDDGAGDVKAAPDTGVRDEALNSVEESSDNNEMGSPSEVSDSEGDGAEGENPPSSFGSSQTDYEKGLANLDNQQEQDIQKQKFTEDCGADNLISRNIDSVLERDSDKAEDMDLACDKADVMILNCDTSKNVEIQDEALHCNDSEQVSNPKTITNSEEEDDYELSCPICNQCVTRTIIFRRREMIEDSRTTCFSWLISQICCIGK